MGLPIPLYIYTLVLHHKYRANVVVMTISGSIASTVVTVDGMVAQ
jgi:hypothetical protein